MALNLVNEYVSLYTKDQLQLVPQEQPWGFTEQVGRPSAQTCRGLTMALPPRPAVASPWPCRLDLP